VLQQFQAYVLTLVALLGAYTVYWAGVSRILVPPRLESPGAPSSHADGPSVPRPRRPYEHLFSDGDWELATDVAVRRIETRQGTLLFREYKPLSATRLEITPFTLIVYPQQKEGTPIDADPGRPVVIRAPQGAKLLFEAKVDLTRGEFGPIQGGELNGPVKIFGPESQPGLRDEFVIETTNVKMDQRSISTPEQVTLHYGPNEFVGSDLVISLAGSPQPDDRGPANKSPLSGIETLTLYTFEKGILYPEAEKKPGSLGQVDELPEPIEPVEVVCNGSFKYIGKTQVATLERDVVLTRRNRVGDPDRATFPDALDIHFGRDDQPTSDPLASSAGEAAPKTLGSQVQKVVGRGSGDNPAVVDAPSRDLHAVGDVLEYDVKLHRAIMRMLRSGAMFQLRRGQTEFSSPEIHYEIPPKGKTLGRLWAAGPGKILAVTNEETEPRTLTASWRKQMTIQPQDANELISLEDSAQINFEGTGDFRADKIHLWVLEIPKTSRRPKRAKKGIGEPSPGDALLADGNIVPDRMQAIGRVRIESPQLNADAKKFEAWFQRAIGDLPDDEPTTRDVAQSRRGDFKGAVREPAGPGGPLLKGASPRQPAAIQPSVARQMPSMDGSPKKRRAISEPDRRRDPNAPPPQQFHVAADLIQMQLVEQAGEMLVDEVRVEGKPVKIRETRVELGVLPLTITGKMVYMEDGASGAGKFTIYGGPGPAEIAARGMKLSSPKLEMSQRQNRVWSKNPGNMTLMQERDLNGKVLPQPQEILVTWQDGMAFDGLTALFEGDITVDGDTQHAEARVLKATLSRRVDFTDPQIDSDTREQGAANELATISLIDDVFLESRTYDEKDGRQVSLEKMEMRSLTIDQATGDVTGVGPGHVSTVRKENGKKFGTITGSAPAVDRTPVIKNRPDHESITEDNQSLGFLKVNFADKMRANTQTREASFGESVEAIYGPVPSWESELAAERRESLGERGLLLYCESLVVRQMPGQHGVEESVEFEALGNAHVEGQLFTASARQLSYASNKQQLVLKGDGRSDAEIRHHTKGGFVSSREIKYNTATGAIKTEGMRALDTGYLGDKPPKNEPRPPSPRDFRNRR
jgi:hypothetical protein